MVYCTHLIVVQQLLHVERKAGDGSGPKRDLNLYHAEHITGETGDTAYRSPALQDSHFSAFSWALDVVRDGVDNKGVVHRHYSTARQRQRRPERSMLSSTRDLSLEGSISTPLKVGLSALGYTPHDADVHIGRRF